MCVCVLSEMSLWPSVLCSLRSAWLPSLYEPLAQSDRNKKPYSELGIGKTAFFKKKKNNNNKMTETVMIEGNGFKQKPPQANRSGKQTAGEGHGYLQRKTG